MRECGGAACLRHLKIETNQSAFAMTTPTSTATAAPAATQESASGNVVEKYKFTLPQQAVIGKDWAAGTKQLIAQYEYLLREHDGKPSVRLERVEYPPALLKAVFDEPLVNAIDHCVKTRLVTRIALTVAPDGLVTVYNNGPGIETDWHAVAGMYTPELIFGVLYQGENVVKGDASVTGGTNGIGAKLGNCFSTAFVVETVSGGKVYIQKWSDNMMHVERPLIMDAAPALPAELREPHTKITMRPDYHGIFRYESYTPELHTLLCDLARTRIALAASFLRYVGVKCELVFNGSPQHPMSACEFLASAVPDGDILSTVLQPTRTRRSRAGDTIPQAQTAQRKSKAPKTAKAAKAATADAAGKDTKAAKAAASAKGAKAASSARAPTAPNAYPWELAVAVVDKLPTGARAITCVNGVVVRAGPHIDYVLRQLAAHTKLAVKRAMGENAIKIDAQAIGSHCIVAMNCQIPGVSWTGQRKDVLELKSAGELDYQFDDSFVDAFARAISERILAGMSKRRPRASKSKFYDNYRAAGYSQSASAWRHLDRTRLLLVEGNSALTQLLTGMTQCLDSKCYGIMSMKGVIINVRKESAVTRVGDRKAVSGSKKMNNCEFLRVFCEITGLDTCAEYRPDSLSYVAERRRLRYGGIIVCVDQDHDGMNILGLVLSMFEWLWPQLLASGYVSWWQTPIKRAFPANGGHVLDFYTESEYQRWLHTVGADAVSADAVSADAAGADAAGASAGSVAARTHSGRSGRGGGKRVVAQRRRGKSTVAGYTIEYFKGLGTHSRDQIIGMFQRFYSQIFTILSADTSHRVFEIYYGRIPMLRKVTFEAAPTALTTHAIEARREQKRVLCDDILRHEVDESQRANIARKIIAAEDGMNISGRKIYNGSLKAFANNAKMKVSQLSGYISATEEYHHGEESLHGAITGKAFLAPGGRQLPPLVPLSHFGNRLGGGADAASPRYIFAKFNWRLNNALYPPQDYHLLEFTYNEGVRTEPRRFCPIIPTACVESVKFPATAWSMEIWARDVFSVIRNVRRLIAHCETVCAPDAVGAGPSQGVSAGAGTNVSAAISAGVGAGVSASAVSSQGASADSYKDILLLPMPPDTYKWHGEIDYISGVESSFGRYEILSNSPPRVLITELPLRVWTNPYLAMLGEKAAAANSLIDSVENNSTDTDVRIEVTFVAGAFEKIRETHGSSFVDPICDYLLLRHKMNSMINLLGHRDEVLHFDSYDDVIRYWFPYRRDLYAHRVERELKLLQIAITWRENVYRYACASLARDRATLARHEAVTAGRTGCVAAGATDATADTIVGMAAGAADGATADATANTTVDTFEGADVGAAAATTADSGRAPDMLVLSGRKRSEQIRILEERGFIRIRVSRLQNPEFTPTDQLEEEILGKGADYGYLLNMSDSKKSAECIEKYAKKLNSAQRALREYESLSQSGGFPGAKIWLRELDKLEHEIREGRPTDWLYEDKGKFLYIH